MSEGAFQNALVLLGRTRRTGTVLRVLVLLGAVAALACLQLAASRSLVVVDVAVLLLVMCAVVVPDAHFGTLVVTIIGAPRPGHSAQHFRCWCSTPRSPPPAWPLPAPTGRQRYVAAGCSGRWCWPPRA